MISKPMTLAEALATVDAARAKSQPRPLTTGSRIFALIGQCRDLNPRDLEEAKAWAAARPLTCAVVTADQAPTRWGHRTLEWVDGRFVFVAADHDTSN